MNRWKHVIAIEFEDLHFKTAKDFFWFGFKL